MSVAMKKNEYLSDLFIYLNQCIFYSYEQDWKKPRLFFLLIASILGLKFLELQISPAKLFTNSHFVFLYIFPIVIVCICLTNSSIKRKSGISRKVYVEIRQKVEKKMGIDIFYSEYLSENFKKVKPTSEKLYKFYWLFLLQGTIWIFGILTIYIISDGINLTGLITAFFGILFDFF